MFCPFWIKRGRRRGGYIYIFSRELKSVSEPMRKAERQKLVRLWRYFQELRQAVHGCQAGFKSRSGHGEG